MNVKNRNNLLEILNIFGSMCQCACTYDNANFFFYVYLE